MIMANTDFLLYTIITIFVILGVILPYIESDLSDETNEFDVDGIANDLNDESPSAVTIVSLITSVFSMFFWTFGTLPLWLDLILFSPLRIIALIILLEKIPFT